MVQWHGGRSGASTTLALPDGTLVGDLLICGDWNNSFTDSRLTKIEGGAKDGVWIGYATTLDPLTAMGTGGTVVCASLAAAPVSTWSMNTGDTTPAVSPSVSAGGTVLVSTYTNANIGGNGGIALPPGYSEGVQATTAIAGIRIDYWNGIAPSPTGEYVVGVNLGGGGISAWRSTLIVPGARGAPAARKHPRSDGRGFGSGRIFPPPSTQQAGRLTGPY